MTDTIEIKVKIFDDGKKPVTCTRDATKTDGSCPYVYTKKFGQIFVCHLFKYTKLNRYKRKGDKGYNTGYLIPCKECLTARKENQTYET